MMTAIKTLLFTIFLVMGVVTVGVPYLLLGSRWRLPMPIGNFHWLGLLLIVAGALIYLWCAWEFTTRGKGTPAPIDPPRKVVTTGLYRYTRNPMYVGVSSVLFGEALFLQSGGLLIYAALVTVGFHLRVIYYEEPVLHKSFGASFDEYCRVVPRWLPRSKRTN
jgi:protein-S-isoprenylcysteine O-methyltransferase Ste14